MNKRIVSYSLSLVLVVSLVFGLASWFNAQRDITAAKYATMARFATFASNQYEAGNVDQLDEAEAPFIFGIQIHNRQGKVLFESPQFKNIFGQVQVEFRELHEQKLTTSLGQKVYVYTRYSRDIPGYVSVFSRADQGLIESQALMYLIIALLLALMLAGLWSSWASAKLRSVADRFIAFFDSLKKGDHSKHLYVEDHQAVGEVAHAANSMRDHMEALIDRLHRQALENDAVFGSIATGVVAVSRDKRILRANAQAGTLLDFHPERVIDRNILEVIRNSQISDAIDELLAHPGRHPIIEAQFRSGYHDIRVLASPIQTEQAARGAVLIFEDVTEATKLEAMRRDFVSNVSHELKTPLTSIKGFTETMLEQDVGAETRYSFLSIINDEVDRLNDLVSDLFVLSEIEKTERSDANKAWFNPYATLEEIDDMLTTIAHNHVGIELIRDYAISDDQLYGNVSLFKQLVINLLENAVKYSRPEGGKVTISAGVKANAFVLAVEDEGIGISSMDAKRIFERFYRVDQSRSLDVPGTGLGLAIVKHIVISLRGQIDVESELGQGSCFRVTIPLGT